MLRGQPAAFVLLIDIGPIRDTDQRVMGLVHIGLGEIDVIRRDQRDAHVIGHLDKAPLGQLFGYGLAILAGVALQLDIKPVGKSPVQPCHQCLCRGALTALQQLPHGAARPARQTDQPTVQRLQLLQGDLRQRPALVDIKAGVQLHQVFIPGLGLGQQNHRGRNARLFPRLHLHIGQIHLTADDRLHTGPRHGDREFQRGEHVVGIRQGQRRHIGPLAQIGQLFQPQRPFQQRIFGVRAQVNESGCLCHGANLPKPTRSHQSHRCPAPVFPATRHALERRTPQNLLPSPLAPA